jgi:signal transduction histidine kinase
MDLSLLGMKSGSEDPALMERVQSMKGLVDRAIQGVRNVAVNLRPTALDMGLIPALEWLSSDFTERTGIACVLRAQEENIDLDETRAVVIFRIVQESLTNITRYAEANQVDIHLGRRGNELEVAVRDNGRGFDLAAAAKNKSFGLLGMHERALALGGRVNIASAPGQGTMIGVTIPIDPANAQDNP